MSLIYDRCALISLLTYSSALATLDPSGEAHEDGAQSRGVSPAPAAGRSKSPLAAAEKTEET